MATLDKIVLSIQDVIKDDELSAETKVIQEINDAVQNIAAGIRMPPEMGGGISPPLVDLYAWKTLQTSVNSPFISLPDDYQRNVFRVFDDTLEKIEPPVGGDYYAFTRFLKQIQYSDFSETGEVYRVCIKGRSLYYQGIPASPYTLGIHYYRKPAILALDGDVPEGIPEHLQQSIIKHYVCKELFGEKIEDGQDNKGIGTKYHTQKFFEDMCDLIDYVGRESEPMYYGDGGTQDRGACD